MNEPFNLTYYDRSTGALLTEPVYAKTFLFWSYNSRSGQIMTDLIFRQKVFSKLYGWLHKQPWSKLKIKSFARQMKISEDELLQPLDEFASFNDFFTREIDLSKRPINNDPGFCIAPTDGKVLAYRFVPTDMTFRIKNGLFNLRRFLKDDALTDIYANGSLVISRLSLRDYHHIHFPDSGVPKRAVPINGKYYAVGPYALRAHLPFYTENRRTLTLFDSDHFGRIAIVEVGGFTVASIQQRYEIGTHVAKGAHKAFFELGGSTVVLLFERGAVQLDEDLCFRTLAGIETFVKFGDSIGRR
jgi:phosphatidylserine decarboxylase